MGCWRAMTSGGTRCNDQAGPTLGLSIALECGLRAQGGEGWHHSSMDANWIDLAEAIDSLREQFQRAEEGGRLDRFRFGVQEIQMEFLVEVRRVGEGKGKVKLGVVEVGAGGSYNRASTHRLTVTFGVTDAATGAQLEIHDDGFEGSM